MCARVLVCFSPPACLTTCAIHCQQDASQAAQARQLLAAAGGLGQQASPQGGRHGSGSLQAPSVDAWVAGRQQVPAVQPLLAVASPHPCSCFTRDVWRSKGVCQMGAPAQAGHSDLTVACTAAADTAACMARLCCQPSAQCGGPASAATYQHPPAGMP